MTDMDYLDGNAAAGLLSEVFAVDITAARAQCAHCGDVAVIAQAHLYTDDHGMVLRCRVCGDVVAMASERTGRLRLDLHGLRWVELEV